MAKKDTYIQYGVPSDWAQDYESRGLSASTFRATSKINLRDKYGIPDEQIEFVKNCLTRDPIEPDVMRRLLENSNFLCCLCKGKKSDAYILHHIVDYSKSQDNSYENLAVLCPNDHDLAHRKGVALTNKITEDQIKTVKKNWEEQVVKANEQSAVRKAPKEDQEQQKEEIITISDVIGLINSLKSNTTVYLKKGVYNLSEIVDYDTNPNVRWKLRHDGYEPRIRNLSKLKLIGEEGTEVLIDSQYSWVLRFDDCTDIHIENIISGHVTPGTCMGGVYMFKNCESINIQNSILYGSGTHGIRFENSSGFMGSNLTIRECTYGIAQFYESSNISFVNCDFTHCQEFDLLSFSDYCTSILFRNCKFLNNTINYDGYSFVSIDKTCSDIVIELSEIRDNEVNTWVNEPNVLVTKQNEYSDNEFADPVDIKWYDTED